MIVSFIAIALSIVAIIIGILAFRSRKKQRKVVLLGERQTGKTRLFSYLSRKETGDPYTLPTVEAHEEQITPTVTLIDTPGGTSKSIQQMAEDLSPRDLILFLYNKKNAVLPKGVQAHMIRIYTGEDSDVDSDYSIPLKEKELPYDKLSRLSASLF